MTAAVTAAGRQAAFAAGGLAVVRARGGRSSLSCRRPGWLRSYLSAARGPLEARGPGRCPPLPAPGVRCAAEGSRIPEVVYILGGMPGRFEIEVEPEVRSWLDGLPLEQYARAEAAADLLAERAETLGEPYSRHLGGKTRELRFHLHRGDVRVSYWLARAGGWCC